MSNELAKAGRVGQLIGAELRRLREALGLTQEEVVSRVRQVGLPWTVDILGRVEAGRREDLTVSELLLLTIAFGAFGRPTIASWFSGNDLVRLSEFAALYSHELRPLLEGKAHEAQPEELERHVASEPELETYTEAEQHAAKQLGVSTLTVRLASMALWERPLDEERERRLDEERRIGRITLEERRARRGHITRGLLDELRRGFDSAGPAERRVGRKAS